MEKAKAVEILNKMFDSYLTIEEACLDTTIKVDDKQFTLRDKLDEITDEKIALLTAIDALKAEPEKRGRWINEGSLDMYCSSCGETPDSEPGSSPMPTDYCPYCGARMDSDY